MIRRSRQSPATSIRDDLRARFLDVLKRAEQHEVEATTDVRRALDASGWRKTRHQAVKLFPARRAANR
jgi:hypothetical protein